MNVLYRQCKEQRARRLVAVAPQLALENRIVLVPGADRLVEDSGVGGDAAQIVVLDDGRVVGVGTHRDLMATSETYQEIVLSQLSAQEAA